MKKLVLAVLLTMSVASLSFGASACTGISAGGVLSGTLATFISAPSSLTGCDFGDKIFSNFTYSGGLSSSNVNVQISQGLGQVYQVIFTAVSPGSFTGPTTISFLTTVDNTVPGFQFAKIIQFQDQMNTAQVPPASFTPNASTEVATHTGFTTVNLNASSGAAETGQTAFATATSSTTTITYNPNGDPTKPLGQAFSFEVDIIQAVPEPMTMSLMGFGLLAVGAFARRFKKS